MCTRTSMPKIPDTVRPVHYPPRVRVAGAPWLFPSRRRAARKPRSPVLTPSPTPARPRGAPGGPFVVRLRWAVRYIIISTRTDADRPARHAGRPVLGRPKPDRSEAEWTPHEKNPHRVPHRW